MELLNSIQDEIWKAIFSFFYPVTDCTPVIFIIVAGLAAILFFWTRRTLWHKTYTLGILEVPMLLSMQYFIEQLPRLHKRVQVALSTTADILLQSTEYVKEFQSVSNVQPLSNASISRYLYYLNDPDEFSGVMPEQLYYHLFKTLKETRGIFGFIEVHNVSGVLLAVTVLLIIGLLIYDVQKKQYFHGTFLLILGLWIFYAKNGVILAVLILIFLEHTLAQIFPKSSPVTVEPPQVIATEDK